MFFVFASLAINLSFHSFPSVNSNELELGEIYQEITDTVLITVAL